MVFALAEINQSVFPGENLSFFTLLWTIVLNNPAASMEEK